MQKKERTTNIKDIKKKMMVLEWFFFCPQKTEEQKLHARDWT